MIHDCANPRRKLGTRAEGLATPGEELSFGHSNWDFDRRLAHRYGTVRNVADSPSMEDPGLTVFVYAAAGLYVMRGVARVLRDFLELRNEWYWRER